MQSDSTTPAVILVIEDNPFVREMICDWLRRVGYRALAASSERGAARILEHRPVDLAIIDLDIHRGEGLSLVRSVEGKLGGAGLVFLSRAANQDEARHAVPAESAVVGLGKPYSLYVLEQVVRAALARAGSVSAATRKSERAERSCCDGHC
ncbi:MAG TPA: response regulator [Burkholderiales bacterium]|nr:response regulator [Burkholderiales bacterium]